MEQGWGFLVRGGEGATIYGRLVNMYPIEWPIVVGCVSFVNNSFYIYDLKYLISCALLACIKKCMHVVYVNKTEFYKG